MNNATSIIELAIGVIALISVLYQVARIEKAIFQAIDAVKVSSDRNFFQMQNRLDLHLQDYASKKQQDDRNFNALTNEINHECGRLRQHQKDIEKYLAKDGFRIRTYYTTEHDFGRDEDYQQ